MTERLLPHLLMFSLFATGSVVAAHAPRPISAARVLVPVFRAGDRYGDVFSRTTTFRADGFDEDTRRVSGTAEYRVLTSSATDPRLRVDYRYDGIQHGTGITEFRKAGSISCFNGKCHPNTDASGLIWNPRLWGAVPATLRPGQRWSVRIAQPWELGPPGREAVTVVALDARNHSATLKREGRGEGAFLGDRLATTLVRDGRRYRVRVVPGRSHWYGYTRVREGIIMSDELVVKRAVTLVSAKLGSIPAQEREYILLNAMPEH